MTASSTGRGTRTIAETSDLTGMSAHTLRYYERIGLLDRVDRDTGGRRRFREEDLAWLAFLTRLRTTGMPIRTMQRFAELRRQGDKSAADRLDLLRRHRETVRRQIAELADCLEALDAKVEYYEELSSRTASGRAG
ncbi:MerR family transcriptional regulator [Streptomyces sp. TRM66268-LWL]|uniref:MerR family transcriptional regulator n=1 Tax=Streptomyces polyasparticus TaxID=2767826 RepID=A0ABR7SCD7_9ACTN|nr:MerR family transcriptional regulator [Streptomyces polyasparticus]MBC9713146.1 MerR family transcriptional regulator [Streptomyces polyasparticus]